MKIKDVRLRVKNIKLIINSGDYENAHKEEDNLYHDVLREISKNSYESVQLAKEVLKTEKISFDRWYA